MKTNYSETEPLRLEKIDMYVWRYRWNIHTEEYIDSNDTENVSNDLKTRYVYNYIDLYVPFTSNDIILKVISEVMDINKEQKLINEYNEAVINGKKTNEDKEKIENYKNWLSLRNSLKNDINNVCNENGII